ncbi:MAG: 3'-5' exonuclease [Anaerolineales bacterium]|nr:3'-5' exonuclease [Anaerolineales bacterium]
MESSIRKEAQLEAQRLLLTRPVYLDTETTGTSPQAEIIEVALVDDSGAVIFNSLVLPRGLIHPEATRIHGITPAQLAGARSWPDVWAEVAPLLAGRYIGAYNAEFDLRMLKQSHQRSWLRWDLEDNKFFCIMKLYARFHGEWDRRRNAYRHISLEMAGQQCNITIPNSHRAADDARLARALLIHMAGWDK